MRIIIDTDEQGLLSVERTAEAASEKSLDGGSPAAELLQSSGGAAPGKTEAPTHQDFSDAGGPPEAVLKAFGATPSSSGSADISAIGGGPAPH